MKNKFSIVPFSTLMVFFLFFLSSCQIIEGIFKAGVWTGIIFVVFILAIVIFIIAKIFSRKKNG